MGAGWFCANLLGHSISSSGGLIWSARFRARLPPELKPDTATLLESKSNFNDDIVEELDELGAWTCSILPSCRSFRCCWLMAAAPLLAILAFSTVSLRR